MKTISFLFVSLFALPNALTIAGEIKISSGKDSYQNFQDALLAASNGDTLFVKKGTYLESEIRVEKKVVVLGEPGSIVDVQGEARNGFVILHDSISIQGMEVTNVGASFLMEVAAFMVRKSNSVLISGNRASSCFFGIYIENSDDAIVSGNHIQGQFADEVHAGNAIHAWQSDGLTISDNECMGHRDGIYFEFVNHSNIQNNLVENNFRYGLHFMFSNNDRYEKNSFLKNGAGVAVMFSRNIDMVGNLFKNSWGGASYGLLLKEINDGHIASNTFEKNTIGILAEGVNRMKIERNHFLTNGTALDIKGNCLENLILENNFIANTFDVVTNTQYNNNNFSSNYWSSYSGFDLDRDGIGDIAYRPVNVFARIIDKIPAATFLLHSAIVGILEMVEKIIPQIIPSELVDNSPKMNPISFDPNQ